MAPTNLTDLPPELLDHITTYLPTAASVANLSSVNKTLNNFAQKDGWQIFGRTRFPSQYPNDVTAHGDAVRSLSTLSRAWDRRAFVARYIEPSGRIYSYPQNQKIDRWKRPRGQTIGFMPQLDCYEEIGATWRDRNQVLAFSAGSEVCIRNHKSSSKQSATEKPHWTVYRPLEAKEGIDDITSLHLLRPTHPGSKNNSHELITGTANGELRHLRFGEGATTDPTTSLFSAQGLPVRSSSLLQQEQFHPKLLAANLGDTRISLYQVDSTRSKIEPTTTIDIPRPANAHRTYRAWSTNFLSDRHLCVGLGPFNEPIHVYSLTPSGLEKEPVRKFSLQNDEDRRPDEITAAAFAAKKLTTSVYPIVPLPPASSSAAGSADGQIFLSGAYDGVIRLHDLRSEKDVELQYSDPTDDSAIYSLLPRGQEALIAGTSRHSILKVFDLRLGAKAYSYRDVNTLSGQSQTEDWNLFLKPDSAVYSGRGGGNNWARRSAESSIYSLTSPSIHSPFLYAGVADAVVEMAFTSVLDANPDPIFFDKQFHATSEQIQHSNGQQNSQQKFTNDRKVYDRHEHPRSRDGELIAGRFKPKEILNLAMYGQNVDMKLMTQRSLWETMRLNNQRQLNVVEGLDERWIIGSS